MCGRYTLSRNERDIAERFGISEYDKTRIAARFNVAPSQEIPVVLLVDNHRVLQFCKWGLVPSWVKDSTQAKPLINARAETLSDKPSFRKALTLRRCIIPADGFYEWKKLRNRKLPMYIRLRGNQLFGIAGLWEDWTGPDGNKVRTCTIITVPANNILSEIHDRMPAILPPEMESAWLDHSISDAAQLAKQLMPYPDEQFEAYPVSTLINSAAIDSAECIAQVEIEAESDAIQQHLNFR